VLGRGWSPEPHVARHRGVAVFLGHVWPL